MLVGVENVALAETEFARPCAQGIGSFEQQQVFLAGQQIDRLEFCCRQVLAELDEIRGNMVVLGCRSVGSSVVGKSEPGCLH